MDASRILEIQLMMLSADGFEELVHALAVRLYPDAQQLRPPDGGADTLVLRQDGTAHAFQAKHSQRRRVGWRECEGSLAAARDEFPDAPVTFVFPFLFTAHQRRTFAQRLGSSNPPVTDAWTLDHLRELLATHADVRERLLDRPLRVLLGSSGPSRFSTPQRLAVTSAAHVPGWDADLVHTPAKVELELLLASSPPTIVALEGPGGVGKTRLVIDALSSAGRAAVLRPRQAFDRAAVGELADDVEVLVIDDAHRVDDLSGLALLREDRSDLRVVLTLRPGQLASVLDLAALVHEDVSVVEVGLLPRPALDELLRNRPYEIGNEALRGHIIVNLAKGNPLIAHLAARTARELGLSVRTQRELLQRYVGVLTRGLPSPLHHDVLTLTALFGTFDVVADRDILTNLHPAVSLPMLRSAFMDLADAGLVVVDDDVASVKPDAIAPVIVADAFLPPSGTGRIALRDLQLAEATADRRRRILPTLGPAVVYADGRGREALRAVARRDWPAANADGRGTWVGALNRAHGYVEALSSDAAELITRFVECRTPAEDERSSGSDAALSAAAELAHRLFELDASSGLPLLLELAIHDADDSSSRHDDSRPSRVLERALTRGTPGARERLTSRGRAALDALRAWFPARGMDPAATRVGVRAATLLVATSYDAARQSAADAFVLRLGTQLAPETEAHRAMVLDAAQLVAAYVPELEIAGQLEVIDKIGLIDLRRTAGPAVGDQPASEWASGTVRAALQVIRDGFAAFWRDLPLAVRYQLVTAFDEDERLSALATQDEELRDLRVVFPVLKRRSARQQAASQATDRGRELGLAEALSLVEDAFEAMAAAPRMWAGGAAGLLSGAAEDASADEVRDAMDRIVASSHLRGYLPIVLGTSLPRLHDELSGCIDELATAPDLAPFLPGILDAVPAVGERRLFERLAQTDSAHVELARHLSACHRLPDDERQTLLLELAERCDDARLASVLENAGRDAELHLVAIAPRHIDRLIGLLERLLRTSSLSDNDGAYTASVFELVAQTKPERLIDLVEVRLNAVLDDDDDTLGILPDLVPRDLAEPLNALPDDMKDKTLPRVGRWMDEVDARPRGAYRAERQLAELFRRLAGDRRRGCELVASWAGTAGRDRERAFQILHGYVGTPMYLVGLKAMLEQPLSEDERGALFATTDLPDMWVGDLEQAYAQRAEFFETLASHDSPVVRAFAADVAAHYRREHDVEQRDTRRRREGYDD